MSLAPSTDQLSIEPCDALQAVLIVAPDGRIQFATERARLWLKNFLHSRPDRLPEAVIRWLDDGSSGGLSSRFIVDQAKLERIADVVRRHWPEQIHLTDLQQPALIREIEDARAALLETLDLAQLL